MILKFFRTTLPNLHHTSLVRASAYFMSNDEGNNKGFNRFQRKKKMDVSKSGQTPKEQQKKQQNVPNKQQQTNKQKQNNDKSNFDANKTPDAEQQIQRNASFSNFQRRKKISPSNMSGINSTIKKTPTAEPKINQSQNQNQNHSQDANIQKNQNNLSNKQPQPEKQQHEQQPDKQHQTQKAKSEQQQKAEDWNETKGLGNKSGFSNFKRNKNNEVQKNQKAEQKQNKQNIASSTSTSQPKVENQNKGPSFEQVVEDDLKRREQDFKKKLLLYKQMKMEKKGSELQFFTNFINRIVKKIQQQTGIDLGPNVQPPTFIKNNPILLPLFRHRLIVILGILAYLILDSFEPEMQQITSQQVIKKIENGQIKQLFFERSEHQTETKVGIKDRTTLYVLTKQQAIYQCVVNREFQDIIRLKVGILNSINPQETIFISNKRRKASNKIGSLRTFLSLAMLWLFFSSIAGASKGKAKGGMIKGLQNKSKRFKQNVNVKFKDVVGMQKAKQQIVQFIDFLQNPQKYHRLGARIPRGALLTGPPGTGKTMIAKACAGQSKVPFFTISGSQFVQMYVGVGAQRVRDLFAEAKKDAPSIIFIDEIDAVGKKRSAGFRGGNDERDNTLNQLLVQMDGFDTKSNVIVFAATNQKQVLDNALTRPGRFDRLIQVDLPDLEGRRQIFMVHLRPIVIDSQSTMEDYAKRMATLTPGFSGADIKNLCNEAAIMAARNGNKFVTMHDFELATQRVIAGVEKKSHLITAETRKIIAFHECGHGVVSWFLQGANPLLKLTIIPRSKGSLGFSQFLPHQTQISTKKKLEDQICVILAGRISQEVFFGRISTGAYDDLQKAYKIAKDIVTQYGMNEKLGWLNYNESQYAKFYSKQTQELIDKQIHGIVKKCTQRTRNLILQKRELIEKLASKLLQVQTLNLSNITEILGERPFKQNKQYEEYLKQHRKIIEQKGKQKPVVALKETRSNYLI